MIPPDILLHHYRFRLQFRQGRWHQSLLARAEEQLQRQPCNLTLADYLDIVQAINGYSPASLQQILATTSELEHRLSDKLRYRVAALCLKHAVPIGKLLGGRPFNKQLLRYPTLLADTNSLQIIRPYKSRDETLLKQFESQAKDLLSRTQKLTARLSSGQNPGRICIVGNAPTELGKKQQQAIDSADLVFRFNNAVTNTQYREAYGSKTDYWTISPSYTLQQQQLIARKIIISGVSPFDKPSLFWQALSAIRGTEYFTFPEQVWYSLVARLQAPPSAGLLCLATLLQWRSGNTEIDSYGISLDRLSRQNHYADSTKRSTRHNWAAESTLARQLLADGNC